MEHIISFIWVYSGVYGILHLFVNQYTLRPQAEGCIDFILQTGVKSHTPLNRPI
jgi:hypothetical protein